LEKHAELQKAANALAVSSHDPHYKALIAQTLKDIEELLGKEVTAARNVLEKPSDENKKKVGDSAEEVHKALDELFHTTRPAGIAEQASRVRDGLIANFFFFGSLGEADWFVKATDLVEKIKEAVKRGDDKAISDLLKQLDEISKDLEHQAKYQAQNADDIKHAKQIVEALAALKKSLADLEGSSKKKDQPKTNADGEKVWMFNLFFLLLVAMACARPYWLLSSAG